MTNSEKTDLMIEWLKVNADSIPDNIPYMYMNVKKEFLPTKQIIPIGKTYAIKLSNELECFKGWKLFGFAFKSSYIKAYYLKKWFEINVIKS